MKKLYVILLIGLFLSSANAQDYYIDFKVRSLSFYADVSSELFDTPEVTWHYKLFMKSSNGVITEASSDYICVYDEDKYGPGLTYNTPTEEVWSGTIYSSRDYLNVDLEGWESDGGTPFDCIYDGTDSDYANEVTIDADISANSRNVWTQFADVDNSSIHYAEANGGNNKIYRVYFQVWWNYTIPGEISAYHGDVFNSSFALYKGSDNNYRVTSWDYEVSDDASFSNIVASGTGITPSSSVDITGVLPSTTYYYHVRGINEVGTGNYGTTYDVTTDPAYFSFTDGYNFNPSVITGQTNQAIGRFALRSDVVGGSLTYANIKLEEIRSGLSNFKLWVSSDNTFDSASDVQVGTTVAADPGINQYITFSSFSADINTTDTYFFLTCDIASDASGSIKGIIEGNIDLKYDKAGLALGESLFNEPLSQIIMPLPVEITSFEGTPADNTVELTWETATETNNFGFNVECAIDNVQWEIKGFVKGSGNSNSPKEYLFVDEDLPNADKVSYRLKQIDNEGSYNYSKVVEVDLTTITGVDEDIDYTFSLNQNYPNPFNPTTTISFTLPNVETGHTPSLQAKLVVYNLLGQKVKTLVNETKPAGAYAVSFDASELPSGIYFYALSYGSLTQTRKLVLMK